MYQSIELGKTVPQAIDLIADMRKSGGMPNTSITLARWSLQVMPKNVGVLVVVTNSSFIVALSETAGKVYPKLWMKVALVKTVDEAVDVIMQRRAGA